ncbi:MAG: YciI family protein [Myxococcota bacterium]
MDWMLLIVNRKDAPPGEPVGMAEMGAFAGELGRQGKMRGGAPLLPEAAGARIVVRGAHATVTDGPFAEAKEVVGGFFVIDAANRAEAIEIAQRCPHARAGIVELRPLPDRDVAGPAQGVSFMLLLHMAADLHDADGAKYREMVAFDELLRREGRYVESAQLPLEPSGARISERSGRLLVTDGPFTESKEVAGGYYIVSAPDRDAAIEIAKRCPHARWGVVEVREIMKIGPI